MISEHTKLINCFIGLTKNDDTYPKTLRELGYIVDSIEPNFKNKENERINPDILLTSRKLNHCMFLECKGGNNTSEHDKNQKKRYDAVEKNDFINMVDTTEPDKLNFDICFALCENLSNKMNKIDFLDKKNPVLLHKDKHLLLSDSFGKFKPNELNSSFSTPINIGENFPTHYYPFGFGDSMEHIAVRVLRSVVHLVIKGRSEFTVEDVLMDSHPLWARFDETHKKKMRETANKIVNSEDFGKITEYIKKAKGRYKIHPRSLQALQDNCNKIIKDIQEKDKQTTLFEK